MAINLSTQVNILLSTFNGETFLFEQLESLYKQTYPNAKIIVRDDGSIDSTLDFLKVEQDLAKVTLLPIEPNVGPALSFFKLLEASGDAGFYAFCDQDDIWSPNKIQIAVDAIQNFPSDVPVMYFSRVVYVDSEDNFIKLSPLPRLVGFGNALVENIATGCTIMMNKPARDLLVRLPPNKCLMHDSWCYLVISCFGEVIFDPKPSMRYRQHSNNVIGASTSFWDTLARRVRRFSFHKNGVFRFGDQAELFLNLYEDSLPLSQKLILLSVVDAKKSFLKRLKLAINLKIWRQSILDDLILRVLILLNRY